eukprot:TRINITY_DN2300_c0_g2_i2.p1 TRINITY_DN2300_c0_g2~~TRINITY_DN2300_c0_g2_i2.p1  ORF type:complete len:611 (+),score=105.11 TRINITY_DN2300_c0_g2_i2:76-1833(+)
MSDANAGSGVEVFVAKKIITMNDGWPTCTAVAVKNGMILGVGSLETLKPWLKDGYTVNTTFKSKILVPGFIDPHMHPLIGGVAASLPCLAYYDQPNPYGKDHVGLKTKEAVKQKLVEYLKERKDDPNPLLCWGYDQIALGGHLDAEFFEFLDEIPEPWARKPVAIWDASMHYVYTNRSCIDFCEVTPERCLKAVPTGDIILKKGKPSGTFLGNHATGIILSKLVGVITTPAFNVAAMKRVIDLSVQNGLTCVSELGLGLMDLKAEMELFPAIFNDETCPVRCVAVVHQLALEAHTKSKEEAVTLVKKLHAEETPRFCFSGVKFFTDDAFVGLTMQLCGCPGYIDGHKGIWLTDPGETYTDKVEPYWKEGIQIHVHSNGDDAQNSTIQLLADLQARHPRFDHRFTFEHYGISTVAHARKLKALGACASVNIYYPHLRGELNENHIGTERSHMSSRLGTLLKYGVPTALHTDTPIAPPSPLGEMWVAVNRFGQSGAVLAPAERVSAEAALRMVTLDAAYLLKKDHLIGSIEAGKCADFTVLDQDPLTVPPAQINNIKIWGTVMSGVARKASTIHTWVPKIAMPPSKS